MMRESGDRKDKDKREEIGKTKMRERKDRERGERKDKDKRERREER